MTRPTNFGLAALAVLVAVAAGFIAPAVWAQDNRFVAGFEDLPLMPGLEQGKDSGTVFDTPAGRVIEAYAEGSVMAADVDAFYAKTLPQLGWRQISDRRYRREGEILEITPHRGDRASVGVRFYLSPEGAAQP